MSKEPTPSKEPKEPECLEQEPPPRGVGPEPSCVDRGLTPRMAAPELGLNETMELLCRGLGAGNEDPDLSALSAALRANLGLSDLKQPFPTISPGVEPLTSDVKSCRGVLRCPMDTCPSPLHPPVRPVPFCSVGDNTEAEMKSYGLAALAPVATTQPSCPSGGTGDPGVPGRRTKSNCHSEPSDQTP